MKRFQKDNKKPTKSYTRGNIVGIFGLFRTFFPAVYCQIANISLMKQRNALFLCFIFWAGLLTAGPGLRKPPEVLSNLELDYFINYQWSFQLRARASMLYRMDPGLLSFNPSFSFNTVYYFF